ncbi:MAG TPA: DUF1634 domain-containing protein [bacterium]|nr:DUF1634 domain-containing protein [bacterium]
MSTTPVPESREEAEVHGRVYHVLVAGMAVSTTLFAIGLLLAFVRGDAISLDPAWMAAHVSPAALAGLVHGDPAAILLLATMALIATPILRVTIATWTFAREGDRLYSAICATVLCVVVLTVLASRLGLR